MKTAIRIAILMVGLFTTLAVAVPRPDGFPRPGVIVSPDGFPRPGITTPDGFPRPGVTATPDGFPRPGRK